MGAARHSPDFEDRSDEPTSYGGSFASSEFAASTRHLRLTNNLRPFSARHFPESTETIQTPKPSAPTLIFQPAQRTIVHEVDPSVVAGLHRTVHTTREPFMNNWNSNGGTTALVAIPPTVRPVAAPPSLIDQSSGIEQEFGGTGVPNFESRGSTFGNGGPTFGDRTLPPAFNDKSLPPAFVDASVEEERRRQESLANLLDCCQQQAPGCRHLCTPSVSKEQVG